MNVFTPNPNVKKHDKLVRVDRFTRIRETVATGLDAFGMLQWVRKHDPLAAYEKPERFAEIGQIAKRWHTADYYYTASP